MELQHKRNNMHHRKKVCFFCANAGEAISYKDTAKLKKYVTEGGKILPRRVSGCCQAHQRFLTTAIKRARHIALMPYTLD